MEVDGSIIETIEYERLICYVHLQEDCGNRWAEIIYNWLPGNRRKKCRPKRRWKDDVKEAISYGTSRRKLVCPNSTGNRNPERHMGLQI
jgi:hypothetical protein